MGDLDGETVLVTGGASGLGRATAGALTARGAAAVLLDIAPAVSEAAEDLASTSGRPVRGVLGDVRDPGAIDRALAEADRLGRLTMVHGNAGVDPVDAGALLDTTEERWDFVLSVNLGAAVRLARASLPRLLAHGDGRIVFTSSVVALRAGEAEAAYTVSKAALIGLARSLTRDYGRRGLRANAVCPGPLEAMTADRRSALGTDAATVRSAAVSAAAPLGREGRYREVAGAVAFLLGPESSYVAGASLTVDGGMLA